MGDGTQFIQMTEVEKRAPEKKAPWKGPAGDKRKPVETLEPTTSKKAKKVVQDTWRETKDVELEVGDDSEVTTFELPLFPHEHVAAGFNKFSSLALADGIQARRSGIKQAAVLTTHATNMLFLAAHKEAKAAEEHKKTALLAQTQSARIKELTEKLSQSTKDHAELNCKVASLTAM